MMVYYISIPLFQIFTQSLDAIYVTSVTLSRLNSINAIDVTKKTQKNREILTNMITCTMSFVNMVSAQYFWE